MFKPRRRRTDPFATVMFVFALVIGGLACLDVSRGGSVVDAFLILGFCGLLYALGLVIDRTVRG